MSVSPSRGTQRAYFIAFDVPKEVHAFQASVNTALAKSPAGGSWIRHFPPHITIKHRFFVSEAQEQDMWRILHELVQERQLRRFTVRLCDIQIFPKNKAIYLSVRGDLILSQMLCVIRALEDIGIEQLQHEGWVPHITLAKPGARRGSHEGVMRLIKNVPGCPSGEGWVIDRLCVYPDNEKGRGIKAGTVLKLT